MARILVIDDDESVRTMVRTILERAGHEVLSAANGKEAMPLYRSSRPDLIVTNILMPEKEGLETIQEIRRTDDAVKIIAISGGGQIGPSDYLEVAKRFGADRTLAKPFDRRQLTGLVDELVGGDGDRGDDAGGA